MFLVEQGGQVTMLCQPTLFSTVLFAKVSVIIFGGVVKGKPKKWYCHQAITVELIYSHKNML